MKIWHFTEQAYHPAWKVPGALRVTFPQYHCDPVDAGQLLNRYLDEYILADELGLNVMVNEHHATATCLSTSVMTTLSILARATKKARLLALGIPLANRTSVLRVAEEIAMVDCLSGGRVEVGFVKGSPLEVVVANRQPTRFMERFWEAHDVVTAALSNPGEPFAWEGEHFHYRSTAMWPRPIQHPHPPIWGTASSGSSARPYAKLGYVCATFVSGAVARSVFDGYRDAYVEWHGEPPSSDRLGYLAVVACASNRAEAFRRADAMKSYFHAAPRIQSQFLNVMGLNAVEANMKGMQKASKSPWSKAAERTVEDHMKEGMMFVGTPDEVYRQIVRFNEDMGGFGHLLMMGQAGDLSHADTVDNLTLIATEVAPRLAEIPEFLTQTARYESAVS